MPKIHPPSAVGRDALMNLGAGADGVADRGDVTKRGAGKASVDVGG